MEAFVSAFTSLGFPAACVAVMAYFIYHFIKRMQEDNAQRENNLMELITTCQGKLVDVATVLERLCNEVDGVKQELVSNRRDDEGNE